MKTGIRKIRHSAFGNRQCSGFSLVEMLLAVGILGIGLVLVAMVFPAAIKLTGIATDRTLGAIAAKEAAAKIQLYGLRDFQYWPSALINANGYADPADATYDNCDDFLNTIEWNHQAGPDGILGTADDTFVKSSPDWDNFLDEFLYPSVNKQELPDGQERNIRWSALCLRTGLQEAQVAIFVTRTVATGSRYYGYTYDSANNIYIYNNDSDVSHPTLPWPSPVPVAVGFSAASPRELSILTADPKNTAWDLALNEKRVLTFFSDNVTIVANHNGKIYKVTEYKDADADGRNDTLVLSENWEPSAIPLPPSETIWVVPRAIGSDRDPVIAVSQDTITTF